MKKIMFNDKYGLTQAVLEGRKTQTRRIVYTQNGFVVFGGEDFQLKKLDNGQALLTLCNNSFETARYKIGEEVAIAQKYADLAYDGEFFRLLGKVIFEKGCHNKMFVKADFMPHRIRITNIRVERLQDISEDDCLKEGIWRDDNVGLEGTTHWYHGLANSSFRTAKEAYAALIDKISGKGTWQSNPWVFVYDFELVKQSDMDRTKYVIIDCKRRPPKRDCTVLLCKDRATDKFCFVNTSSKHVCSCRFDTIKDAIKDLESQLEVISYRIVESAKYPLKPNKNYE